MENQLPAVIDASPAPVEGNPLDLPVATFRAGLDRRKANRGALLDWIRSALVEGTDYGKIVGNKPSLLKPGAEKICGMLGVEPTFPTLSEYERAALEGRELQQLIIRCEILNAGKVIVATGVGARSLAKDKGDLNKALKMACKSAHIDATLRMAGLSEVFTQDLEDTQQTHNRPESPRQGVFTEPPHQDSGREAQNASESAVRTLEVVCGKVKEFSGTRKSGKNAGQSYTGWWLTLDDGKDEPFDACTFSRTFADRAKEGIEAGRRYIAEVKPGKKQGTWVLDALTPVDSDTPRGPQDDVPF